MIGGMDQPITIERKVRTPDLMGGASENWVKVTDVWAKVTPKSGKENLDEGRTNATFVVVFTIYQTDITEADRIMWNAKPYNIRGILDTGERDLTVKVEAERGVAS